MPRKGRKPDVARPRSFRTPSDFRVWLERHHASSTELMIRLFKVSARDQGIGYREALDEALCFGWIDGVRRALDDASFTQRFSPRKAKSTWSAVNIRRATELIAEGRMHAAGLAAFHARDATAVAPYSFERPAIPLDPAFEDRLRANARAWAFWSGSAPYYRRVCAFYVMSARRPETRERRFRILLAWCAKGRKIPPMDSGKG